MVRLLGLGSRGRVRAYRAVVVTLLAVGAAPAIYPSGASAAGGGSFYVNCSSGKDTNPGTAAAPWKSLTKASAATLGAGEELLLARGCVWDGQRLEAPWDGTAAAPITI